MSANLIPGCTASIQLALCLLAGAHTLGKNHNRGATWVADETKFDNQYYKDMLNSSLQWRQGIRQE